jgi:hypothetical protein
MLMKCIGTDFIKGYPQWRNDTRANGGPAYVDYYEELVMDSLHVKYKHISAVATIYKFNLQFLL